MADSSPWIISEAGPEDRKYSPAAERNSQAIADVLRPILPDRGTVLEIASGSGQHVTHLARQHPDLLFQPSDVSADALRSIAAWIADAAPDTHIQPPIELDVLAQDADSIFPANSLSAAMCINLLHISPWEASEAVFRLTAKWLKPGAPLFVYGPFLQQGVETAPSNMAFDENLRSRDPRWGIRAVADIVNIANVQGFAAPQIIAMPANNLSLAFRAG